MIYVMSDIHGNKRRFRSIMEQINLQPEDTLYVLGDVIDRFPDGITLLQELMAMPNAKLLMGNHEYMMLNVVEPSRGEEYYMMHGFRDLKIWYSNEGYVTHQAFQELEEPDQKQIISFLKSLPMFYEVEVGGTLYQLVHGAPLELYPHHKWDYHSRLEFTVWHRWSEHETAETEAIVIFGHTPTWHYKRTNPLQVYWGDRRIGIDCGSGFPLNARSYALPHGRLACLRLDDMRVYYSDEPFTDEDLESFWDDFSDILMDPESERMEEPFLDFPAGTPREDIWHWFDERHSKGVYYLLYERK